MTIIPSLITARIVATQAPSLFSGKGHVEKAEGDGRFVIALSTGKITVQCTQCTSGSLACGDYVSVKIHGKELLIEKMNVPPAASPNGISEDALNPGGNDNVELNGGAHCPFDAPPSAYTIGISGETQPAEGFYYFNAIGKALSWLASFSRESGKNIPPGILDALKDTAIVLLVSANERHFSEAAVIPVKTLDTQLAFFIQKNLKSRLWHLFSPEGFISLLKERVSLPMQRIEMIDSLLPENYSFESLRPASDHKTGPGMNQTIGKIGGELLFVQWLKNALDETIPPSALSVNPLMFSSGEIPLLLETSGLLNQPGALSLPLKMSDFTISQSTFDRITEQEKVLPKVLRRLGIDSEYSLLRCNGSEEEMKNLALNLKLFLLKLLSGMDSMSDPIDDGVHANALSGLHALHASSRKFAETWIAYSNGPLQSVFTAIDDELTPFEEGLLPALIDMIKNKTKELLIQFQGSANDVRIKMESFSKESAPLLEQLSDIIRQNGKTSNEKATVSPVPEGLQPISNASVRETLAAGIETLAKNTSDYLSTVSRELDGLLLAFSAEIKRLLKESIRAQLQSENPVPGLSFGPQLTEKSTAMHVRLRMQVEGILHGISEQAMQMKKTISEQVDRFAFQLSRAEGRAVQNTAQQNVNVPPEASRQQIEAIVQRIETMQITAKTAVAGDARQQVFMVPMKIDGQWNDVIVQFIRNDKQGKKGKKPAIVSVMLNVAPAFIGEITAYIDYRCADDCSIRMCFERDSTLSWFERNKTPLIDALGKLGFRALRLNMQKNIRRKSFAASGPAPATQASEAAIDIVV